MTVARVAAVDPGTGLVTLDAITDVGEGNFGHWYNPGGAPTDTLLYFNRVAALMAVNTPPPFVASVHAPVPDINTFGAGGGAWMYFIHTGGVSTIGFDSGASTSGRLDVPAGVVVDQTGRMVFLSDDTLTLYFRSAAGAISVLDSGVVMFRPHIATQGICWQRTEGGQFITYGQRGSGIERVHMIAGSEFWATPVDTPVGPWILAHDASTLYLRAWGQTTARVIAAGVTHGLYPHAVYSSTHGGFLIAWVALNGSLETRFLPLDVTAVPGPTTPSPIPGGGGGGSGPGGSTVQPANALTVTPPPRFAPTRRAIYPHVPEIGDKAAQQSVKLLWDRIHAFEQSLEAERGARAEVDGRITTLRTDFETRLSEQATNPTASQATGIPAGGTGVPGSGSGGSGGGGGGTLPPPGTPPLPMLLAVVQAYDAANPGELANSCQSAGGTWDFMDGALAALRAVDPRFGYNGKRGNVNDPSHDAVSYYWGPGAPFEGAKEVYIVDIIGGHCGANPTPSWTDQTLASVPLGGAWITRGMF